MAKIGGTKGWVAAAGAVLLMAFVAVPALSGAASAAPVTSAATSVDPSSQWAYGGEGWSNTSIQAGDATIGWNATFGWTVVFTATPTGPNTIMLEEKRTLGITVSASYKNPTVSGTYYFHGQEVDVAFANLTNLSTVYVDGQPVPALGVDNASVAINASIAESVTKTIDGNTASASLNVLGVAHAATSFSPSLGLIPLNLTGVSEWNSTAIGSPSAAWNVSWSWKDQGFNGTTGSGSGYKTGSLSGTGQVNLTGYKVLVSPPVWSDHKVRVGVILVVQGVFDCYDGLIFVPHAFDLFGSGAHPYDSASLGSAGVSAETLYLSPGPNGPSVTAAASTFGSNDQSVNTLATPQSGLNTAVGPASPGATVDGQPMTVPAANAEANCLTNGCGGSAGASGLPVGLIVLAGAAAVVVVGTVGVIEWRSYARRHSQKGLVGGYGESWPNGVPPATAQSPPTMGSADGTMNPPEGPNRQP